MVRTKKRWKNIEIIIYIREIRVHLKDSTCLEIMRELSKRTPPKTEDRRYSLSSVLFVHLSFIFYYVTDEPFQSTAFYESVVLY